MSRVGRWSLRAALVLTGTLIALLAVELALRAAGVEARTPRWFDPTLGWRFFPEQQIVMRVDDQDLGVATIDAWGYRASPPRATSDVGGLRVACVGDSWTFGWSVADDATWPARLHARSSGDGAAAVQVANFGVPGWNTVNELRQYPRHVRSWRPDVVLVGFSLNDLQPEDRGSAWPGETVSTALRDTALLVALQRWVRPLLPRAWTHGPPEPSDLTWLRRRYDPELLEILAEPEGHGAPWFARAVSSLEALVEEARADGARVAVLLFPQHAQVAAARALDPTTTTDARPFGVLDRPQRRLAAEMAARDVLVLDLLPHFVAADDEPFHAQDRGHPGVAGHELITGRVLALLRREGWLEER